MKAKEFIMALEEFRQKLAEHEKLWGKSLSQPIPDYPVVNEVALKRQSQWLCRKLGSLRPFIERFDSSWRMHHPATGVAWDALDAVTGLDSVAQIKGPTFSAVEGKLNRIIGQAESLDPLDEIPADRKKSIKSGADIDQVISGYLYHLHPYITSDCVSLFLDGHYPQAIEESAKAVFQYVREKTGLTSDGAQLAQDAFSISKPILAFNNLADETKKNEQVGFMEILKGFAKGVRNPLAHTHGKKEEAQKAFEYLVLASLLCRRIDDASPKAA